jgi:hypothetical protein
MTRINPHQVLQMVNEERLVLVDDRSGSEIIIAVSDIDAIVHTLRYFQKAATVPVEEQIKQTRVVPISSVEELKTILGMDQ